MSAPTSTSRPVPWGQRPRRLIGLMLAGLLGLSPIARGGIIRVGTGAGCDASTVQQGVDLAQAQAGPDTIQLADTVFFENVVIDGMISSDLIIIKGSFDGCSNSPGTLTGLFGLSSLPAAVRLVRGAGVVLSDLQVTNPGYTAIRVRSDSELTLENAFVTQSGIGVSVGRGSLVVDASSQITDNHSTFSGAGIRCDPTNPNTASVFVAGLVAGNSTTESGGGIWATDGCQVTLAGAAFWSNVATDGGGAIYLDQGAQLTTIPTSVTNVFRTNSAERGGAIYARDAGTSIDLDDASIHDNQAVRGGGIYTQSAAQATLKGGVEIYSNSATAEGGGVAAYSDSVIALRDGVSVRNNSAADGGGFYLATRSFVSGSASGSQGIEIVDNEADYGGGLYLTGADTEAILFNYHVRSNQARLAGGGVAVRFGAFLEMNRGNSIPCANPPRCSVLSGNVLTQGSDGSALYVDTGASAKLYQTYIEHNRHQVLSAASRVVQTRDSGTTVRLEGIQFWENDATYLMGADDASSMVAGFVTAARNAWTLDANTELPVLGATANNGGTATLASSILVDTRGYSGAITSDCLIVDDDTGLGPTTTVSVGVDPLLTNPDTGDLHLLGGSLAIDYCDAFFFGPDDPLDLDLEARGVDHPTAPLFLGFYDIGMDETLATGGVLFADGFESGDTSAWDGTDP